MDLYRRIADSLRQDILMGRLKPGQRVPSVRRLSVEWDCTAGTVQRAFRELQDSGLIESLRGRGSHVVQGPLKKPLESSSPLRRARLVHRAEAFLLESLTLGHTLDEVESAVRLAMDRWRVDRSTSDSEEAETVRFVGSHDLAVVWMASHFDEIAPGHRLELTFAGSLGGLMALAEGRAEIAGTHLLDEESGVYNEVFVSRILAGRRVALITLARRRLGLVVAAGNPLGLSGLSDLAGTGVRFVNRQHGSGTRVWLDQELRRRGIPPLSLVGYDREVPTHSEVATLVADSEADAGLALEGSAVAFGLGFIPLAVEVYDLAVTDPQRSGVRDVVKWLGTSDAARAFATLGGYETDTTGRLRWIG